jgi:hypothetical protein
MNVKIISAFLVLSLATLACGFSIDLPERQPAGPDVEETIAVEAPDTESVRLAISFGAGELRISPGAEKLVDGTIVYNVEDLEPEIIENGNRIEIKQGEFKSLPPFDNLRNEWDLQLGSTPMDLVVSAGAYDGTLELGGLALQSLEINDGASNVDLSFSEPNATEMSILSYSTGASDVTMTGLANANFSTMSFKGGAGNYTLDFSGELQQDAVVTVDSGFGNVSLLVPEDVSSRMTVEGAAVNINHGSGWSQNGNEYTQEGEGPTLTFIVKMAAGNLMIDHN